MKILHETDTYQIVEYPNQMQAIGLAMVLSSLTRNYGSEQVFAHTERLRGYIEQKLLVFYHQKGSADAPISVPMGWTAWAYLSKPMEIIYTQRFRPLMPRELRSGPNFWVMEMCAPMGGQAELREWLGRENPSHPEARFMRVKNGKPRATKMKNPAYKEDAKNG